MSDSTTATAKTPDPFRFDFLGKRTIAAVVSIALMIASILSLIVQGLNLGLDFTEGSEVEVALAEAVPAEAVREQLTAAGFEGAVVQNFGSDRELRIRMPVQAGIEQASTGDRILEALAASYPGTDLLQSNFVGPAVGEELRDDGGLALLAALIVVMIYILIRFTKQFAVGAVAALVHDVLIVLGLFSLFRWTFDLPALAALLAVIGYSLNDTIVVSDRIRENFRRIRRGDSVTVINRSLNQTLGRTLVTSLTTLFVLLALLFAGGEVIRSFALALTFGVLVGTYSSIYVVSNVLLWMNIRREDLLEPIKEGADDQPLVP
ncbi:MAG: protein translocase subunit SecF [Pseudomonadota bacterium]